MNIKLKKSCVMILLVLFSLIFISYVHATASRTLPTGTYACEDKYYTISVSNLAGGYNLEESLSSGWTFRSLGGDALSDCTIQTDTTKVRCASPTSTNKNLILYVYNTGSQSGNSYSNIFDGWIIENAGKVTIPSSGFSPTFDVYSNGCYPDADSDGYVVTKINACITCSQGDCCEAGNEAVVGCNSGTASSIYPGNYDIPGNLIDEDCQDGDALLPSQILREIPDITSPNQNDIITINLTVSYTGAESSFVIDERFNTTYFECVEQGLQPYGNCSDGKIRWVITNPSAVVKLNYSLRVKQTTDQCYPFNGEYLFSTRTINYIEGEADFGLDCSTNCLDEDQDGYGQGSGCVSTDCDDDTSDDPGLCPTDTANCNSGDFACAICINENIAEDCADLVDNDCDGLIDAQDPDCACGNNQIDGAEECDNLDYNGETCDSLGYGSGTLYCNSCLLDTTNCGGVISPRCGNNILEDGEECDGLSYRDGNQCSNYGGYTGTGLACKGDCTVDPTGCTGTPSCQNGVVDQLSEDCDQTDLNLKDCTDLNYDSGTLSCNNDCTFDKSACTSISGLVCGNDILEDGEECDGTDLPGTCSSYDNFVDGTISCTGSCKIDATSCVIDQTVCGDNIIELGEECDGIDLGGIPCTFFDSYTGGIPSCDGNCNYDVTQCTGGTFVCGDDVVNQLTEECDLTDLQGETCQTFGYDSGTLSCNSCNFDTSLCDPPSSGPYCGDNTIDLQNNIGFNEQCDGTDVIGTCPSPYTGGIPSCNTDCTLDYSLCTGPSPTCSDTVVNQISEDCDTAELQGETCQTLGYSSGTLSCNNDCTFNKNSCLSLSNVCGNDIIDQTSEECDTTDLNLKDCTDFGYGGGTLSCNNCVMDKSNCWVAPPNVCGNGALEPANGEACDTLDFGGIAFDECIDYPGYSGGNLICTPGTCIVDYSSCDPYPCAHTGVNSCPAGKYCSDTDNTCYTNDGTNCDDIGMYGLDCAAGVICNNYLCVTGCPTAVDQTCDFLTGCCQGKYCRSDLTCQPNDGTNCDDNTDCGVGLECDNRNCIPMTNVGDSCLTDYECTSGQFCDSNMGPSCQLTDGDPGDQCDYGGNDCNQGTCENNFCFNETAGSGDSCITKFDCGAGLICVNSFCEITQGNPEDQCGQDSDCDTGYTCTQDKCYDPAGELGRPCTIEQGCGPNYFCNVTIASTQGSCNISEGQLHNICDENADCDLGLKCIILQGDYTGLCFDANSNTGDDCSVYNELDCSAGYYCDGLVCQTTDGLATSPCGFNNDCASGNICENNICKVSTPSDSYCGDTIIDLITETCEGGDTKTCGDLLCTDPSTINNVVSCNTPGTAQECQWDKSSCLGCPVCDYMGDCNEDCQISDLEITTLIEKRKTYSAYQCGTCLVYPTGSVVSCSYNLYSDQGNQLNPGGVYDDTWQTELGCEDVPSCYSTMQIITGCTPEPEVCDGIDNNCDGFIDEGCVNCVEESEAAGNCNDGIDNDCDGECDYDGYYNDVQVCLKGDEECPVYII